MKGKTVIELIASALLILFLYAAISQVIFHDIYYSQLSRSLSSAVFANIIIWSIPVVHILLGWLLWRPSTRLAGLIGVLAAVSLYTIYLFIKLPAGSRSACRCGELWQQASLEINILFNLAVILLAAITIILMGRLKTNSPRLT
jgi:hypothetical protein